jgi:hypothetical protein
VHTGAVAMLDGPAGSLIDPVSETLRDTADWFRLQGMIAA